MPLSPHDCLVADELRVMHWNIQSWRDKSAQRSNVDAVARLLRETDPHAVSLVEVDEPWGVPTQLARLADSTGYSWIFTPTFEYGDEAPTGGFGNALLTRLPVLGVQHWQLAWPPRLYDGSERSEPRSLILGRFGAASDESLWIGSTHLPRQDVDARVNALNRLRALTHALNGPWMICGDFNTPASAWVQDADPFAAFPEPAQPTYPTDQPTEPIDYCIAPPGLLLNAEVLPVGGSDHLPVLFRLRRASIKLE